MDGSAGTATSPAALTPVMQLQVGYNVKATDDSRVSGSVFLTVHKAPKE